MRTFKIDQPATEAWTEEVCLYEYGELSETAKENVKSWFLRSDIPMELAQHDCDTDLEYIFPNSNLSAFLSVGFIQGDRIEITGQMAYKDIVNIHNRTNENPFDYFYGHEITRIRAICLNNRLTSVDIDTSASFDEFELHFDYFIEANEDSIITSPHDWELLDRYKESVWNYLQDLKEEFLHNTHDILLDTSDSTIIDTADVMGWEFTEDGDVYNG